MTDYEATQRINELERENNELGQVRNSKKVFLEKPKISSEFRRVTSPDNVPDCDMNGRFRNLLEKSGRHDELLAKDGLYAEMWKGLTFM